MPQAVERTTSWQLLLFTYTNPTTILHGHSERHFTVSSLSFRGDLPQGRGSSLSAPETFGPWNTAEKTEGTRTPALQSHSKDWMIHAQSTVWNVEGVRKAHRQNSGAINVFCIIHELKTSLQFCCVSSGKKKILFPIWCRFPPNSTLCHAQSTPVLSLL